MGFNGWQTAAFARPAVFYCTCSSVSGRNGWCEDWSMCVGYYQESVSNYLLVCVCVSPASTTPTQFRETDTTHPIRHRNRCECLNGKQVMIRHGSSVWSTLNTWMFWHFRARGAEDKASGCFDFREVLTLFQEFLNRLLFTLAQKEKVPLWQFQEWHSDACVCVVEVTGLGSLPSLVHVCSCSRAMSADVCCCVCDVTVSRCEDC